MDPEVQRSEVPSAELARSTQRSTVENQNVGIKQDQIQPLPFLSCVTVNNFSSYKMRITTSALQGCFVNQIETILKSLV